MPSTEQHANRLRALAESGSMFAEASTDLSRLLHLVAKRFCDLVGDASNIRLIEGDDLVPVATYHADPTIQQYLQEFHDATPLRVGQGISGKVLATGDAYFMPELDLATLGSSIAPGFMPIFEKIGIRGMIVARLRSRGINLGYLALFRTDAARPAYTRDDLHLVQDLADRAALAIDNSRIVDGLERRVAERTQALEAANRELEAFAFSVSHDLRSPLRAISAFSQALEEEHRANLDAEGRRKLDAIQRNARQMSQLVDDLLRLSRLGHRAIQPLVDVDMQGLAGSVVDGIRAANPGVALEISIGELPHVVANAELLRQVWINLLDNAVKYSRRRSPIVIEIAGAQAESELEFTVKDHGVGFDPTDADKLFGVFQRLHDDREFEGTGVGLALVQRIVTRHGGRVWAEGRPGAGATFGFALPSRPVRTQAQSSTITT